MSDSEFAGIDFATGVVRGVRSFRIDKMGRLTGINYPQVWRPGENEAECRKESGDPYARLSRILRGNYFSGGYVGSNYQNVIPVTYSYAQQQTSTSSAYVDYDAATDTYTISDGINTQTMDSWQYAQMTKDATPKKPEPHSMEKCQHGFYAYYDGSNDYHDQGEVTGVVEGYGEVLIGTRGFRCMKARIVALRIHGRSAEKITGVVARNYAEIPQFESFAEMVSAFPPDGGEKGISPKSDPDFWTRSI